MKKIILAALSFFAFAESYAQSSYDDRNSHYGVRGALNIDVLANSFLGNKGSNDNHLGFTGGIFAELQLKESLFIQPEVNYSLKGGASSQVVATTNGPQTLSFNQDLAYINVPVLLKARSVKGRRLFAVYFGPEFGYLLSAKQKTTLDTSTITSNLKSSLKTFDLDLDFGLDIRIFRGFGADIRYSFGIQNIVKPGASFTSVDANGNAQTVTNGKLKNRNIQLSLFYKF